MPNVWVGSSTKDIHETSKNTNFRYYLKNLFLPPCFCFEMKVLAEFSIFLNFGPLKPYEALCFILMPYTLFL